MTEQKLDFSHLYDEHGGQVREADESPDALDSVLQDLESTKLYELSHLDALRLLARLKQQLR